MIKELTDQLSYVPTIRYARETIPHALVIGGMGGSALAGDLFAYLVPDRPIQVHRGYGLPRFTPDDALYIAISHSGNTEETVNFVNEAMKAGKPVAVVTSGGTLASFAEREHLPLALVPSTGAPRESLLYMVQGLLALVGEEDVRSELAGVSVDEEALERLAEEDAHFILPSVPLFYASSKNACLTLLAKVMMNETARMPAFANTFPELNHNEMQAFDRDMPEGIEHLFRFVVLRDESDDSRIERRIDVFTSLMEERGKTVHTIELPATRAEALITTWIRFILAARFLAQTRAVEPGASPLIDAFKKLL
jgi:glucose/mannose-6-phosphate isomerase